MQMKRIMILNKNFINSVAYFELCQTSLMELSCQKSRQSLTIFVNSSIIDVTLGSNYASEILLNKFQIMTVKGTLMQI